MILSHQRKEANYGATTRKILFRGLVAGMLMASLLILLDLKSYVSRADLFNQIELNMPEADAMRRLQKSEVYCDVSPTSYHCTFDDFWRVYRITVSEPQQIVTRKEFAYKRPANSVLFRLFRWIY